MESFSLPKDIKPEDLAAVEMLNSTSKLLGLEPVVTNGVVNGPAFDKAIAKLAELAQVEEKVQHIDERLRWVGTHVRHEGEDFLTADQALERIPELVERAKLADNQVHQLRKEALKWFDSANVDPGRKDMPAHLKKMRARIEKSSDMDFIEEQLSQYEEMAKERFKIAGQKAPNHKPDISKAAGITANDRREASDISESVQKLKRGK